jgi:hypothetical protein
MGSAEMGHWFVGRIQFDTETIRDKMRFKINIPIQPSQPAYFAVAPAKAGLATMAKSAIPPFHHSMCEAKIQPSKNTSNFNRL